MSGAGSSTWPRWIAVLALVALVVAAVVLALRVRSLDQDVATAEGHASTLATQLDQSVADAASLEQRTTAAEQEASKLRKELRSQQSCTSGLLGEGPHVWLIPNQGPPGTRVRLVGDCFLDRSWRSWRRGYGMFLLHGFSEPRECELIVSVEHPVLRIGEDGRVKGAFTVPGGRGSCFQHDYGSAVTPAVYRLGIGCHACEVARFQVTAGRAWSIETRCVSADEPGLIPCDEAARIAEDASDVVGGQTVTALLASYRPSPGAPATRVWYVTLKTILPADAAPSVDGCRLIEQRIVLEADSGRLLATGSLEAQPACFGAPGRTDTPAPTGRCHGHVGLEADLDGDGRPDLIYHDFVHSEAELGVCTAAGLRQTIPGLGQSELLEIVDVQGDGTDEAFFGATSASAQFFEVAVVSDDRLQEVRLPDGSPLQLTSGLELGGSTGVKASAFGCEDADGDGVVDLILVTVMRRGQEFVWRREGFAVEGAAASPRSVVTGETPAGGGDLAMVALARSLALPCPL